jgi:pimeloyl-ACP methyl ester carboxylesterase
VLRYQYVTTPTHGNRISVLAVGPDATPTKAPVYFVHPINLRKEFWLDLIRELATDRICYAADSAGHGESSDGAGFGVEVWVRDHVEVIEALGLERVHLVGGSLGGAIIVGIAAELPQRAISLASLGGCIRPEGGGDGAPANLADLVVEQGRAEVFRQIAVAATAPGTSRPILDTVAHLTNSHDVGVLRQVWEQTLASDARRWAPGVGCPALIANGEFDTTCSPDVGRTMAEAVRGRFVLLPGLGHLPALEDPVATLALLEPHFKAAELIPEATR